MSFWNRPKITESDLVSAWMQGFTSGITSENIEKLKASIREEATMEAIKRLNLGKESLNASNKK